MPHVITVESVSTHPQPAMMLLPASLASLLALGPGPAQAGQLQPWLCTGCCGCSAHTCLWRLAPQARSSPHLVLLFWSWILKERKKELFAQSAAIILLSYTDTVYSYSYWLTSTYSPDANHTLLPAQWLASTITAFALCSSWTFGNSPGKSLHMVPQL